MSKRLYFYAICLAVTYVVFVGHRLYVGSEAFVAGFKMGWSESQQRTELYVCGGSLRPAGGTGTFPSRFLNLKTGSEGQLEITQASIRLSRIPDPEAVGVKLLTLAHALLSLMAMGFFVYLPFVVYRIMKAVSRGDFYGVDNINRIRKASFVLLGIFLATLSANTCMTAVMDAYMEMEGYHVAVEEFNYSLLFLGLVVLALSEILRYTKEIKAEQDLTV
jgi:hypothetical protein